MRELTNLKIKDNLSGKIYRLLGFTSGGDDRSGFPVSQIILYNDDDRVRITVQNPLEMKRLTFIKE